MDDEMNEACSTYGKDEKCIYFCGKTWRKQTTR